MSVDERHSDFAKKLSDAAKECGIQLRLFGGLGCWILCPETRSCFDSLVKERERDIDFYSCGSSKLDLCAAFKRQGLKHVDTEASSGVSLIRFQLEKSISVDVFSGRFGFSHWLDVTRRICSSSPTLTLPPTEMILSKLQIGAFEPKDACDVAMMLSEYGIGANCESDIHSDLIAWYAGRDWGLCFDARQNCQATNLWLQKQSPLLPPAVPARALRGLSKLEDLLVNCPKSFRWRVRGVIGKRIDWRNLVY